MAVYNHRFTVLSRGSSPTGITQHFPKKSRSKGKVEEKEMSTNHYADGDAVVVEQKISRPVITKVAGEEEINFVTDAVFRWEIELNSKYHLVVEHITLKELRIIPESVSPGLRASLKAMTIHSDATASLVVALDIDDFMQIIVDSEMLEDLKLWTNGATGSLSGGDITAIADIEATHPAPNF